MNTGHNLSRFEGKGWVHFTYGACKNEMPDRLTWTSYSSRSSVEECNGVQTYPGLYRNKLEPAVLNRSGRASLAAPASEFQGDQPRTILEMFLVRPLSDRQHH